MRNLSEITKRITRVKYCAFFYQLITLLFILTPLTFFIGCSAPWMKPDQPFRNYKSLSVDVSSEVPEGEDVIGEIETHILNGFMQSQALESVLSEKGASGRPVDVKLTITVTKLKRHNWLLESLTQHLAGKGTIKANVKLSDGKTRKLLASSDFEVYETKSGSKLMAKRIYEFCVREMIKADRVYVEKSQAKSSPSGIVSTVSAYELSPGPVQLQQTMDFGPYFALVIGINAYQHLPRLKTACNDSRSVGNILRTDYGFSVKVLLNPTRTQILTILGEYRKILTAADNLLIYYAGHGWLDEGADEGYWLPVDATRDSQVNWISNSTITSATRAIRAKHVMVVADSCYSGKLVRGIHIARKDPDYLSRLSRKKARVVLSSGGLEPVVDGGTNGMNSVFATAFMEALRKNKKVLDGTELFSKIRRPVMVNSDQTPEYGDIRKAGHAGGDFLFVRHMKE